MFLTNNSGVPRTGRALVLLCAALALSACRLVQLPSTGGDILSADNAHNCYEGRCEIQFDQPYRQTFTATPEPGFEFVTWMELCAHVSGPVCELNINQALVDKGLEAEQVALFAPVPLDELATERVVFDTNYGYIVVELFGVKARRTVENFLQYVDEGFYNRSIIHRVERDFVIQGGGYTYDEATGFSTPPTNGPVRNESINGLSNLRGTVAMARRSDPDSAESQFFINLEDNLFLDYVSTLQPGYTVFGRVVTGMEVVDEIGELSRVAGPDSRPDADLVLIHSVTRHGPPGQP